MMGMTYHRALEALGIRLELLEGFIFRLGALYDGADLGLVDIFEDGLELVSRRRLLGDVQLEVDTTGHCLSRVVARLVLSGGGGGIRRGLLQYGGSPERGRRAGLVKEGDDVESFVLFSAMSAIQFSLFLDNCI